MPDSKTHADGQKRERISLQQVYEICHCCKSFGVKEVEPGTTIGEVGNHADDVRTTGR